MPRLFAIAGGLLFVAALAFFGVSYVSRFDGAGAWSWPGSAPPAAVDAAMFTLFALHHSVFARPSVKVRIERRWPYLERAIYVWIASILLLVVCAAWRPVPGVLWELSGWPGGLLQAAQLAGGVLAVAAAGRLDSLSLAGIRQASAATSSDAPASPAPALDERGPYGVVRHPVYLGWFLMVWSAPAMNGTRLVFAACSCLYLVAAIPLEERDLGRAFGEAYDRYRARTRWRVIPFVY